jgi:hypothetical protein
MIQGRLIHDRQIRARRPAKQINDSLPGWQVRR